LKLRSPIIHGKPSNAGEVRLTANFLRFEPPEFSTARLLEEAKRLFGVAGSLEPLEGERDQNHLLTTEDGARFVLKVSAASEDPGVVDFQIEALEHLERVAPDLPAPRVTPTLDGAPAGEIYGEDGATHKVRLLTYLEGIPHSDGREPSSEGLVGIGRFCGTLARVLADFQHPSAQHFMPWDMNNGLLGSKNLWRHGNSDIAALESQLRPRFESLFAEDLKEARQQVAHFDLHRDNLLRPNARDESVCGVIDFGDMVQGPLVCDPAIVAASFSSQRDPVGGMAAAINGYHQAYPLSEVELALLYDLILARLVQTVLLTDFRLEETLNPPAFLTGLRAETMETVEMIMGLDGAAVTRAFHSACRQ
jgi:Ser/Thr protein kinase RdoA (MazF antagonist)